MLLEMQFPVISFIQAAKNELDLDPPNPRHNYIALSRKNYVVTMYELEKWQWHFLQAMCNGDNYMAAVEVSASACQLAKETILADLMMWMPVAINRGYLYAS